MSDRAYPFSNGSQYMDWKSSNCEANEGCHKRYDEKAQDWRCDIERAIDNAYMDDGTIDREMAVRMGMPGDSNYVWPCPERDPKWKQVPR